MRSQAFLFLLPPALLARLRERAKAEGRSIAAILRGLVEGYLNGS